MRKRHQEPRAQHSWLPLPPIMYYAVSLYVKTNKRSTIGCLVMLPLCEHPRLRLAQQVCSLWCAALPRLALCWLGGKRSDRITLIDVQYLRNATELPSPAPSVKACQAAIPLDSNQAKMKNELLDVRWPRPSQSRWVVLFVICAAWVSELSQIFPPEKEAHFSSICLLAVCLPLSIYWFVPSGD